MMYSIKHVVALLLLLLASPSSCLQAKVFSVVLRKIPLIRGNNGVVDHHQNPHVMMQQQQQQVATKESMLRRHITTAPSDLVNAFVNPTVRPVPSRAVTTTPRATASATATATTKQAPSLKKILNAFVLPNPTVRPVASSKVVSTTPRGGATSAAATTTTKSPPNVKKILLASTATIAIAYTIYLNRHLPIFDKQVLQDSVLACLNSVSNNPLGVIYYMLGLAVWEFLGLSTIPVETAAGMAFGGPIAVGANVGGKLTGAAAAFLCGRHSRVLQQYIRPKLQTQGDAFELMEQSVASKPFTTAILLKYSCVPEFVKNFGASLLLPISFGTFMGATLLHGGPFSVLWSFLGHDAALRLVEEEMMRNVALQCGLVGAAVVGLVVSPVSMAWWINDMRNGNNNESKTTATTRRVAVK